MPIRYNDIMVKIDSQAINSLLIQIKLPSGARRTLAEQCEIINPQVRRLFVRSLGDTGGLSALRGSSIDADAGIMTLNYSIKENLIVRKKGFAFPVRYFFSAVIKNHGEIPQNFSVIEGNVDSECFTYSKQATATRLLVGKKKHAEISPQQWETLYQALSLKLKFVGQAYGIVGLKLRKNGILFCFSEDRLSSGPLAGSDISQPFPIKERVKIFISSSIDSQAQELLGPNEALWSEIFSMIEIEKSPPDDNGQLELRLRFPESIKQWVHIFLLNLQRKIEYARHFGADAGLSLSALINDGYQQPGVAGEIVLHCNINFDIDHKAFIGLLYNLPEDQDLPDMLRLIRCRDADDLDRRLQDSYKGRSGLLDCLANYYLSVDSNSLLAIVVFQELILSLEYHEGKGTAYYSYIAQKIVEITDRYISDATFFAPDEIDKQELEQELKKLKNQELVLLIRTGQDPERAKHMFFETLDVSLYRQCVPRVMRELNFGINGGTVMLLGAMIKQLGAKLARQEQMLKEQKTLLLNQKRNFQQVISQHLLQSVQGGANSSNRKRRYVRSKSTSDMDDNSKRFKGAMQFFMPDKGQIPDADQAVKNSYSHGV